MKTYLLIIMMLLGTVSLSWGQNAKDQAAVMQKCLALPQVSQYYQLDPIGIPVSLYAVANNIKLLPGFDASYNDRKLTFATQEQMDAIKADAYFSFNSFNMTETTANISFSFNYHCNSDKQVIKLNVALVKTEGTWVISEIKNTGR